MRARSTGQSGSRQSRGKGKNQDHNEAVVAQLRRFTWLTASRLACQIFAQDMAVCVFLRKSPSFSPLTFAVELPCFEACWEAETAAQCLHHLQSLPGQLRLSTTIQLFRSNMSDEATVFEASAFGMLVVILGKASQKPNTLSRTNV